MTVFGGKKLVTVYDSLASGGASKRTQDMVRVLAGKQTRVKYCKTCTQQTQCGDCGCFALAYATTLALGGSYTVLILSGFIAILCCHNVCIILRIRNIMLPNIFVSMCLQVSSCSDFT